MPSTHDFSRHHQAASGQTLPPAKSLTTLLPYLKKKSARTAIDLGCGAGTDALHLLRQGWQVTAVDQSGEALNMLKALWPDELLITSLQSFEDLQLPAASLINASFALPFCKPEHFGQCWATIVNTLAAGSGFSGHFFGPEDSWAQRQDMTFVNRTVLETLFAGFDTIWLEETERDGKTLGGLPKHWHIYHVAALKL